MNQWQIPPSTLQWLDEVPRDRPVVMLIRHSVRGPLAEGDAGYEMPLTEDGHRLAIMLGERLRGRLQSAHSSPLLRTVQTAERLLEGGRASGGVVTDTLLGDPGVYMLDHRAGPYWRDLGHEGMMARLVEDRPPLPGCAPADHSARFLVHHMLAKARGVAGIHAFVTHDSLVTATTARLLGEPLTRADWPWYLEAAFFWEGGNAIHVSYRDRKGACRPPLVSLTEGDVIALARREVAATLGLDCSARFFLAGGAFKTLISGKPPHDLDIWAPSPEDRATIEARLMARGAERLPEQKYTQGFRINGRVVELPLHTEPGSLEDRLNRFDIALSAVGVEHTPQDQWRAFIHPRAQLSVERQQILLLEELLNWRHSLTSLERMRRYARELNFEIPPSEEDRIWAIYDSQPPSIRQGMIERFQASARQDQGVAEEVVYRQ